MLDYLADNFVKKGWSVKKLQREILLSSVYRESSDCREDAYKVDPENKLLAVFPRVRMEAEEIRDSLLAAAGKLDDDKSAAPASFPPVPKGLNAEAATVAGLEGTADSTRRSLYIFTRRSVALPHAGQFRHGLVATSAQQARCHHHAAAGAHAVQQ